MRALPVPRVAPTNVGQLQKIRKWIVTIKRNKSMSYYYDIANLQGNRTIPNETMMDSNKKSTLTFRPQAPTEK